MHCILSLLFCQMTSVCRPLAPSMAHNHTATIGACVKTTLLSHTIVQSWFISNAMVSRRFLLHRRPSCVIVDINLNSSFAALCLKTGHFPFGCNSTLLFRLLFLRSANAPASSHREGVSQIHHFRSRRQRDERRWQAFGPLWTDGRSDGVNVTKTLHRVDVRSFLLL